MPEEDDKHKRFPFGGSIPVCLTVLFICLKLLGIVTWSWWWVMSPLFFEIGVALFLILIFFIVFVFCEFVFGGLNL